MKNGGVSCGGDEVRDGGLEADKRRKSHNHMQTQRWR